MPTPRRYANRAQQQAAYRQRLREGQTQELLRNGLPPLPRVPTIPGKRRWNAAATQALLLLQTIRDEMQDYYEERSEDWQEGERGEDHSQHLEAVEEAIAAVEEITS